MNAEPLPVCPFCGENIKYVPIEEHKRKCKALWRLPPTPAEIFDALLKRIDENEVSP